MMLIIEEQFAKKSHVIWDWNGTLLNDLDHGLRVLNRLLVEENMTPTTLEHYRKVFGFPIVDYYKRMGFDTSPAKFHDLCERFNDYFHTDLHHCELWPGARDVLFAVKKSGKMQSLLSASEQNLLNSSIKLFSLNEAFDHVYGTLDKTAASKVDRGRDLMTRASIPKELTVLVGDTDHDLEVGQALGIDVILVEHGHQCPTRLNAVHHNVLRIF